MGTITVNVDDETETRQEKIKELVKKRIEEIAKAFAE